MKKKLLTVGAMVCVGAMCFSFTACNKTSSSESGSEVTAFVSLDINPSIEITLDKNDKVISIYGANEDGQVLIYEEEGLTNVDVETAVEKIISISIELGYLDEDNTVVETSVTTSLESMEEDIYNKISAKIKSAAADYGLSVSCKTSGSYSLLRKLAYFKSHYPDNAAIQALTPQRLKLVLSASDTGLIGIEAAAELSNEELINIISEAHEHAEQFATTAYKELKAKANAAYDESVGAALDGIYASYYASHHPANAYYGHFYQSFKSSARVLNSMADLLQIAENAWEYPLNDEQIAAVAQALRLGDDLEAITNTDGDVTLSSVYAYADKLIKNSAFEEAEEIKAALDGALDGIEADVFAACRVLSDEYKAQIEAIKARLDAAYMQINAMQHFMPAEIKNRFTAMFEGCREIAAEASEIVADGRVTSEEIRKLAEKLEEKAEDVLEIIESDLTAAELEEVKKIQEEAKTKIDTAKEEMYSEIARAEGEARAKIEALKHARAARYR